MERSSSRSWVRVFWLCGLLAAVAGCWYALARDIRYSGEYMGDLRNRVVGARIIADGGSPYFYKWKPGDPLRYYDPQAFDRYAPSISTSTPFLHGLLIPLAGLPFALTMRVWMVVLWLLFLGMTGYAFVYARAPKARAAVLVTALLFLFTNAWELHTRYGQTYLLIPALAMLVLALRRQPVLAGIAAAALVLVRPNAALYLVPFLFARELKWNFWASTVMATAFVLLIQLPLWDDYQKMLGEQVKIHQGLNPATRPAVIDPGYTRWEGLDMDTARTRIARDPVHIYSENGNVFVLYQKITGQRMALGVLGVTAAIAVALILCMLVTVKRRYGDVQPARFAPAQLAILGFCLYMISDLFSPIYRHAYYGVQWIMPLLLAASLYRPRDWRVYGWLLLCLLLNVLHLPFIRMGNTIGEYGFLIGLLAIGFAHSVENVRRGN